jgi:hypothetical protein
LQADANREDRIDGIPLEYVESTEVSDVVEEVSPPPVDVESTIVEDEQAEVTEPVEAAEAEAEEAVVEAESTAEEESTESDLSDLSEKFEESEESDTEEIPVPEEEEKKSPFLIHSTYSDEFSGIRTRMHTTAYPHQTDNSSPDFKPGGNFADESTPVFRTRVHQNTFSTVALAAVESVEETAVEEIVVTVPKKPAVVNKVAAPKYSSEKKTVVKNAVAPKHTSEKKTVLNNAVAPKHGSVKMEPAKGNHPKGSGGEKFSVKSEVLSSRNRKGSSGKKKN